LPLHQAQWIHKIYISHSLSAIILADKQLFKKKAQMNMVTKQRFHFWGNLPGNWKQNIFALSKGPTVKAAS
jgi:hypothetical protein